MNIHSVFDPEFKPYGQVVEGREDTAREILAVLQDMPLPEGVGYVPEEPALQALPAAAAVSAPWFGVMPVQLG